MGQLAEKIYKQSPIWIQNIIISIYGYKIFKQRYGKVYHETFEFLIHKDYSDYQEEINNQNHKLREFLKFATARSPFYKRLYKGIDVDSVLKVEDLSRLPIVDKEMLRDNIDQVYTIEEKSALTSFTGGTTGKSLKVRYEKTDTQRRMAYLDAFKYRAGINPFEARKATFSGRRILSKNNQKVFWRYNMVYKQKLYSTFDLIDKNMIYYVKDLNKFKPEVINGFVSAIYELAKYIEDNNLSLTFVPQAIFTTSETLLLMHRELIERVFQSKIYNQYASAEGAPFITECKLGNLHYNLDTGVIETLRTAEGDQMLVTSFTTKGTPLIRYNIEDTISFKEGLCSCGCSHPLVERIEGRKVDYLYSKTRGKVSLSHLADVIKGVPNSIKKMQFIQKDIDNIDILIVIDNRLFEDDHLSKILEEMHYRFGSDINIDIKQVLDIPRENSGKFSLIKNQLKNLV